MRRQERYHLGRRSDGSLTEFGSMAVGSTPIRSTPQIGCLKTDCCAQTRIMTSG
ncbi:hypothetical protein ABID19_005092 [Mesorhizobium robiniae]|uniref:Uncharacterized protein n=1 Tax=Mesorhizobium robiniae TaxID=559315 RepID=A0ABV2GUR0_9HYPH